MIKAGLATLLSLPVTVLLSLLSMVGLASWPRQIVRILPRTPALLAIRGPPTNAVHGGSEASNGDVLEDVTKEQGSISVSKWIGDNVPSLKGTFKPSWWLPNGHLQTIFSVVGNFNRVDQVEYKRTYLRLPDGGTLGLDFTPSHYDTMPDNTPFIVICHGLTGGSHESYVRNVLSWVVKPKSEGGLGGRGVVVNYRGCAGVPVTSPQLYSAGSHLDLGQSLHYLRHTFPHAPLHGIGFSLGASTLANYLGKSSTSSLLSSGVVLGCPWNLPGMSIRLEGDWLHRTVYSAAMAQNVMRVFFRAYDANSAVWGDSGSNQRVNSQPATWVDVNRPTSNGHSDGLESVGCVNDRARDVFYNDCLPEVKRLRKRKWGVRLKDVDECLTSRIGGPRSEGEFPFSGADAYYEWASPDQHVHAVKRPMLAINAFDDPIVDGKYLPIDQVQACSHTYLAVTGAGGHLGWFDGPFWSRRGSKRRWVLRPVSEFIQAAARDLGPQGGAVRLKEPEQDEETARDGHDGWCFVRDEDGHKLQAGITRGWKVLREGEVVVGAEDSGVLQGL